MLSTIRDPVTPPRVLICYTTAGAGHRRAAEAIAEAARERLPQAQVDCVDVLAGTPAWFRAAYPLVYLTLVRVFPTVWGAGYALLDTAAGFWCVQRFRRRWNLFMAGAFIEALRAHPPDLIVTTHFLPADVCNALKASGRLAAALVIVVTDWHPHRLWTCPEAEAVVVGAPESAQTLIRRGIPAERVHILGIPIARAFHQPADPRDCRWRLALAPERRVILVTSGGTTVGKFEPVVRALAALEAQRPGTFQLVVVCGHDAKARERLARVAAQAAMPMRVLGFVEDMAELMGVSDLVVAKAGGLTVSEALGRGVPLLLYHAIPGQERMNAEHVMKHGAAILARRPEDVARDVLHLHDHPTKLAAMRQAALALARPHAAAAIVSQVVQPLLQHTAHSRQHTEA